MHMSDNTKTTSSFPYFALMLLIIFLGYVGLRLYFYLVPIPDTTLYFKADSCDIIELISEKKNESCFMKGSVRLDLFSDGYLMMLENGKEVYINEDVIEARSFPVKN